MTRPSMTLCTAALAVVWGCTNARAVDNDVTPGSDAQDIAAPLDGGSDATVAPDAAPDAALDAAPDAAPDAGFMDTVGPTPDVPADVAADGPGSCPQPTGDAGNCYRVNRCDLQPFCPAQITNEPARPTFRITQIDVTQPSSLASTGAVGMLLNAGLVDGTMSFGLALDTGANTVRAGALQQGVLPMPGLGFLRSEYQFMRGGAPAPGAADRWDPASGTITATGERFTTSVLAVVRIPIFDSTSGGVLAELPFRSVTVREATMTAARNCIGLARPQYNSCLANNRWNTLDGVTPVAVLEADITVADARAVAIPALMTSLCNVIAGTDCTTPQATWRVPPDATVGGSAEPNAWHVVARFAAVAATIR